MSEVTAQPATIKFEAEYTIKRAIDIMQTYECTLVDYESILRKILATGYDINSNDSELLLSELARKPVVADNVVLLFSLGATVPPAQATRHIAHSHAFNACRVYPIKVAQALFDHIMTSPNFDQVISPYFHADNLRFNVFESLADADKAALYIRVGLLPIKRCSEAVLEICTKAGLRYPPKKMSPDEVRAAEKTRIEEQLTAETAKTARLEEQLSIVTDKATSLQEQLSVVSAKFDKATNVIAQLTSL